MKNSHTIYFKISILLIAALLFGCSNVSSHKSDSEETNQNQSEKQKSEGNIIKEIETKEQESSLTTNMTGYLKGEGFAFESEDYYVDYNERQVNYIQLNDNSILFSGEGAFVSDNKISISKPGTYVIFGTLKDGQIIIEETAGGIVHLILKDATIHSEDGVPIYVREAGKVIISLAPGTKNVLTDNLANNSSGVSSPNATIYCTSDLTLNGSGSLAINAIHQNAISSKGVLKIVEGDYEIRSVGHGIIGKEAVLIDASKIRITAGKDGIRTNNDAEDSKGLIFINCGEFMLTAKQDGIQADKRLVLQDGSYQITSGGGSNGFGYKEDKEELILDDLMEITEFDNSGSAKGLKSGEEVLIKNGTFTLDSTDDAIYSNGSISIENGSFTIASGEDGMHADKSLTIARAKITISSSYEGMEAQKIEIKSGNLKIVSSGGGIDSNGSARMTGGTLIIEGSSNNANGAMNYDDVFEISGGTLLTVGSSGMVMAPSGISKQKSILLNLEEAVEGETLLCFLEGEERIPVMAYLPEKPYQSIVYSSPFLMEGKRYILSTGGSTTPEEALNIYTPKAYEGGIEKAYVTISGILTTYGEVKTPNKQPLERVIE